MENFDWVAWVLVGYIVLGVIAGIAMVGRDIERTPTQAVLGLILGALEIAAIVHIAST
jgi:hypothetical protein